MSSEAIVVLVLIALAIGFVIWVRINSQDYEPADRAGDLGEGETTNDRK